jgi:hypothetical protein
MLSDTPSVQNVAKNIIEYNQSLDSAEVKGKKDLEVID